MSPCRKCVAKCCRYIALQIDTPRSDEDFENTRWYIAHKKTAIFIDKKKWFLEVFTDCRYMTKGHLCSIYDKRPKVCREHANDACEFWGEEYGHDYYFHNLEELDLYIKERKERRRRKERK